MFYISKGAVYKPSDKNTVHITRCGKDYELTGEQAELWLDGRFKTAYTDDVRLQAKLWELEKTGLLEMAEPDETAQYRLLTGCVICPVKSAVSTILLNKREKLIWTWISKAGFKLTISELVYLAEQRINPDPSFFGEENWHILVHAIYNQETIFDRVLDAKMEDSDAMNGVVSDVLGLLRKKQIILV